MLRHFCVHFNHTISDSPHTVSCSTNELCIQTFIHALLLVFETHGEIHAANTRDLWPQLHSTTRRHERRVESGGRETAAAPRHLASRPVVKFTWKKLKKKQALKEQYVGSGKKCQWEEKQKDWVNLKKTGTFILFYSLSFSYRVKHLTSALWWELHMHII